MTAPGAPCPGCGTEPKPGEWLAAEDFAAIIRLTPLVSLDLIVRTPDGRVLVVRRKHEPAKGALFVPGSRVTKNESLAAAFQRIAREELGLELFIQDARLLGVFEHMYPTNRLERAGFGTHYVVLGYEVTLPQMPATLPHDQHGEYFWMTATELLASSSVHPNSKAYFRPA
jgi:GDP-mannose mannosyl hydrolase